MAIEECTIRPLHRRDAEAAAAIWAEIANEHRAYDAEAWDWAKDAKDHWLNHLLDLLDRSDMLVLVAESGGQIVGFSVAQVKTKSPVYAGGKEAFVWDLGVRMDRRRRGFGRKLLQTTLDELKARGANDVILHVARANRGAIELYESLGMRVIMHRMYRKL